MTYSLNLSENEIKRIIADHVGNCKLDDVHLHVTNSDDSDSYYGHTYITASVRLNGPMTTSVTYEGPK